MNIDIMKPTELKIKLRPGHIRSDRVKRIMPRKRRISSNRMAPLSGIIYFLPTHRNQRCIVKSSYTKNTKNRSWAAHGEYLQREHAQNSNEKGLGFNSQSNSIDIKTTLRQWQKENDEHLFKFIISPENGHKMNLKYHAIDLIKRMEKDLKTKLEWVAIDHYNTDHPHIHLLIRGKDQQGNTLTIERDYISRGIRHRSEELATRTLGLRLNQDIVQARKHQVTREYLTQIDRSLRHKAVNSIVSYNTPIPDNLSGRELRLLEIERLKFLTDNGLAKKVGNKSWKLSDNLEKSLLERQLSNDIIKSQARHNKRSLTYEIPTPTQIQENKPLTGKVVGMGLEEELHDRRYLLLEGTDGKVHYIHATNSIVKARDNFEFSNGNVITLEKKKFVNEHKKTIEHIKIHNHISLENIERTPISRIDKDVIEFVKTNGTRPYSHSQNESFAYEYTNLMAKRFDEFKQKNIIQQINENYYLASDWQIKLSRETEHRSKAMQLTLTAEAHELSNDFTQEKSRGQRKIQFIERL